MFRRARTIVGYCFCAFAAILEGVELSNVVRETLPHWVLETRHEIAIPFFHRWSNFGLVGNGLPDLLYR